MAFEHQVVVGCSIAGMHMHVQREGGGDCRTGVPYVLSQVFNSDQFNNLLS
jgi:hypothetical protein